MDPARVGLPETIVTWRWETPGYRSSYGPETVNILAAMVRRHFPHPHRFICVTDLTDGLDPRVEVVPDWRDFASLRSPHGGRNPACYRRLRAFHPEIGTVFGERFVSLDLDTVITGDLTPLWDRPEPFVIWGDTGPKSYYNGSMFLLSAGARPQVWTNFDPETTPRETLAAGCWGSDQGWISYCLGRGEARWSKADGVHSFRNEILPHGGRLPEGARVVSFHGHSDPWHADVQARHSWVREHYHDAPGVVHPPPPATDWTARAS